MMILNKEQHQFYQENGYLKIPGAFSQPVMRNYSNLIKAALTSSANKQDILYKDSTPLKLLYMFNKGESFLKMLASEQILGVLSSLCCDFSTVVPTWEDCIIKPPYSHNGFVPHQDLPLQSVNSDVFTVAIYFTDSYDAPVSFLPGSHRLGPLTRSELSNLCELNKNEFVAVEANQGDIVIHNAKTVHRSSNNRTSEPRYTWYIEFRTINQLTHDSLWNEEWIKKRRAIFVSALKNYRPELLPTWAKDYINLLSYMKKLELKVPHVTSSVDFDMESPYYHF